MFVGSEMRGAARRGLNVEQVLGRLVGYRNDDDYFITDGAVKISHKDSNGNEITDDPVSATWEREYQFQDRVDALLVVEFSEVTPTDQVTVHLAIILNDNLQHTATSIITADKKSTISLSRP